MSFIICIIVVSEFLPENRHLLQVEPQTDEVFAQITLLPEILVSEF